MPTIRNATPQDADFVLQMSTVAGHGLANRRDGVGPDEGRPGTKRGALGKVEVRFSTTTARRPDAGPASRQSKSDRGV